MSSVLYYRNSVIRRQNQTIILRLAESFLAQFFAHTSVVIYGVIPAFDPGYLLLDNTVGQRMESETWISEVPLFTKVPLSSLVGDRAFPRN
jgi:hypothetical protein